MALNVVIPQAVSVRNQTIVPTATYTASDTAGPFPVDFFSSAEITVAVTSCSGTLNVYLQKLLPDNTSYADIASWTQYANVSVYTTTGQITLSFVNGGNSLTTSTDGSLTANTVNTVHFGTHWRLKYVVNTDAVVTFGAFGNFRA